VPRRVSTVSTFRQHEIGTKPKRMAHLFIPAFVQFGSMSILLWELEGVVS